MVSFCTPFCQEPISGALHSEIGPKNGRTPFGISRNMTHLHTMAQQSTDGPTWDRARTEKGPVSRQQNPRFLGALFNLGIVHKELGETRRAAEQWLGEKELWGVLVARRTTGKRDGHFMGRGGSCSLQQRSMSFDKP